MSLSIRRTKHLDECDMDRIDNRNESMTTLLSQKLIMRAGDNTEGSNQIEQAFRWLAENCGDFYSVRGPETDVDSIKYYIYFMNADEMTLFATSFPRDNEE